MLKFVRKSNRAVLYFAILSHWRLCAFLFYSLLSLLMWLCTAVYDSVLAVFCGVLLCIVHLVKVRAPIRCLGAFCTEVVFRPICRLSPSDTVNFLYWWLEGRYLLLGVTLDVTFIRLCLVIGCSVINIEIFN
jgi:hypothetical protein